MLHFWRQRKPAAFCDLLRSRCVAIAIHDVAGRHHQGRIGLRHLREEVERLLPLRLHVRALSNDKVVLAFRQVNALAGLRVGVIDANVLLSPILAQDAQSTRGIDDLLGQVDEYLAAAANTFGDVVAEVVRAHEAGILTGANCPAAGFVRGQAAHRHRDDAGRIDRLTRYRDAIDDCRRNHRPSERLRRAGLLRIMVVEAHGQVFIHRRLYLPHQPLHWSGVAQSPARDSSKVSNRADIACNATAALHHHLREAVQ